MSNFLNKDKKIYKFNKDEMILRDFLAADRTILANERTLLAYIRTGVSLIAVAITLIKLFDTTFTYVVGIIFAVLGITGMVFGAYRYKNINDKMKNIV
ncbi:MAG: DUF202 domain-containing protein [Clostridium tyrobutyricum]|uniref:DUF202 domain-containing protein n=1 Tax=Clostridium tyrobutyricum TaxID=1519 RepID=UPI00242DDC9C|nr:DUF202 domain-containing protein [Clostridium tyrobutyricum]MCH4198513.1 DUF202 domain-containing protein [Clostridium tyrobutyricum]MCH4237427.1 DUF202 domain-containing protein [Clostridium tyrobutyricum]MCH4259018.1 DUF202 domain-containing protein [Clostridium tyrobutyricum]MCI1239870.1 DUF202 domain-containing protein [Clostridium tyrobutyricum]MCI1652961.1 DUF202 domain-containing protein [Clostridium tyrobutyricum]